MAYSKEFQAQLQRWRGQHEDGLSWDLVRMGAERKGRERLRSTPDRRLFDALTAEQLEAYLAIGRAWSLMTAGLGAKVQHYGLAARGASLGDADHGAGLLRRYSAWRAYCAQHRHDAGLALAVIAEGYTLRSAARKSRKDPRTIRECLLACLDGWREV